MGIPSKRTGWEGYGNHSFCDPQRFVQIGETLI